MKRCNPPQEARLPFPTRILRLPNETIELYEIPHDRKAKVLEALYPFV